MKLGRLTLTIRAWLGIACCVFLLAACDSRYNATDVTGTSLGTQLGLQDSTGQIRTLQDYSGKVVVLFFGFLQCPEICPTTMVKMEQVMQLLEEKQANQVQVLFVTVDPERDDPATVKAYVNSFDKRFEGLWGNLEQVQKVADDFRVHFKKVFSEQYSGSYTMEHTASIFILDPKGKLRLVVGYQQSAEQIAADIRALLTDY